MYTCTDTMVFQILTSCYLARGYLHSGESYTLSGGCIFVQNVGTHLSDYMSEPGYHIMNVHCFESLISYTFPHTYAVFHIYCCCCVCDVRIVKRRFYNQRYIKIQRAYREVWLILTHVQKKYFLYISSNCKGFGIICIFCMYQ